MSDLGARDGGPEVMYELGIDTGGTFTDFVLRNEDEGTLHIYKELSTPGDPSVAVIRGIETAERRYGVKVSEIRRLMYGTTVATNAVLERKGAKVGLLTTEGFRDVLEIRRQWRPRLFDLYYVKPEPLVPRHLRLEVAERIDRQGQVLKPICIEEVLESVKKLNAAGVEAVAVSFLFSFLNSVHEKMVADLISREFPQISVSISSRICPEMREYERTATTVLNAYLMPIMSRFLRNLRKKLEGKHLSSPVRIMQSNGGLIRSEDLEEFPINTLLSGPVGGVVASVKLAGSLGLANIITIDMGGTSTDISLIQNGEIKLIPQSEIAYQPVKVPQVDIKTIGAGGGSIIQLFGMGLKVGPQSAGAYPGPASYGRGGEYPTLTDAALVLGYIDPDYFLGGEMKLEKAMADSVMRAKIADPLGMSTEEASYAAFLLQSVNIVGGIRAVSLERGYDPRDFVLVSYGGASGLIVGLIAPQLSIDRVLVPRYTGVFSALGLLMADIRCTRTITRILPICGISSADMEEIFQELEGEVRKALRVEVGAEQDIRMERSCDMRYIGQAYEINVPFPDFLGSSGTPATLVMESLCHQFHSLHEKGFGHSARGEPVEIVCFRVVGVVPGKEIELSRGRFLSTCSPKGHRKSYFGKERGFLDCSVYEWGEIVPGFLIRGPAIIEDPVTTVIVYPGQHAELDRLGNLMLHTHTGTL